MISSLKMKFNSIQLNASWEFSEELECAFGVVVGKIYPNMVIFKILRYNLSNISSNNFSYPLERATSDRNLVWSCWVFSFQTLGNFGFCSLKILCIP